MEVNGIGTSDLFDDLAIGKLESRKYIAQYQGKYPVITVSFKDVNSDSFQGSYSPVYRLILKLYSS